MTDLENFLAFGEKFGLLDPDEKERERWLSPGEIRQVVFCDVDDFGDYITFRFDIAGGLIR